MYNLIMASRVDWEHGIVEIPADRFGTFTDKPFQDWIKATSREDVLAALWMLPTVITEEFPPSYEPRVVPIKKVKDKGHVLRIEFAPHGVLTTIDAGRLDDLLGALDIARHERHSTHWAVKDIDLLALLTREKLWTAEHELLPAEVTFSRRTILNATDVLHRYFTHTDLTRFLVELNMRHVPGGQQSGGMKARLTSIGEYAVEFSNETTEEGLPFAYALVLRAAELATEKPLQSVDGSDAEASELQAYWSCIANDGYSFDGRGFRHSGTAPTIPPTWENPSLPITEKKPMANASKPLPARQGGTPKVFIVHGRDDAPKYELAHFLSRIGLEPVILHEVYNAGRTIITKFQEVASQVEFAIVLMTPDDVGGLKDGTLRHRARQNVIFELGFFLGKLSPSRVCALVKGDLETPSDYDGVVFVPFDDHGGWKVNLMREFKAAGIPYDAHGAI